MKQRLRLIMMTLLCAVFSSAWGAEKAYKTLTFSSSTNSQGVSSYEKTWSATIGGFTWGIENFNNNNNKWSYVKCGSKNNASVATITTSSAIDKAITKVVVTIEAVTAANVNSATLEISKNQNFTDAQSVGVTLAEGDVVYTIPDDAVAENRYYRLTYDCKEASSNGVVHQCVNNSCFLC